MSNRPIIRFNGYQSEWQTEKFSSVFTPLKNNTLSRAELNDEEGNAKNVHYGDILIKFGEYLDAEKEHIPFITSDELAEKLASFALQNGDVIIADTAEDSTVGKCTEIGNITEDMPVVSGLHTIPVRPNADFASGYLGHFMNSDAYHDQLLPLMQGTKVSSIAKTYLGETDIHFPSDISEQEKISSFLRYLNDLIIVQQQKCEKLVALKSAFLDKMFPKDGDDVPTLRLAGYSTAWKKNKVGKVCLISTGKSNTQDRVDDGLYPFYVRSPIVERSNRYLFDEEAVLTVGDGVGTGKVFHYVNGKYDLHQRVYRMFDFTDEITAKFFYYYFSKYFYKRVMSMTAKTSVDSVRMEMISDMDILYPSDREEQRKIAAILSCIDDLIALQQHRMEKLERFKQAMRHSMFV